jgi:hypothetical protein
MKLKARIWRKTELDRRHFLKDLTVFAGSGVIAANGLTHEAKAAISDLGFDTGLRRLHVSPHLAGPVDGSTPDAVFRTIQEALDATRPGDVVTVAAGVYRERPVLRDIAGTRTLPLWICAETRGSVSVSDTWEEAETGRLWWTDAGGGVYHAPFEERPYMGEHDGDFLMAYLSEEDLRADEVTAYSAISGKDERIAKPPYGFAYVPSEGRVYLRLRNGLDPNGQAVKLTKTLGRATFDISRSSHVILDGFVIEGAGNSQAVTFDDHCRDVTVRNCVFRLARHGVRCPSGTILDTCTYEYVGFDRWTRELFALDGAKSNGVFVLAKGYYNAEAVGLRGRGNALLEGSLDFGYNFPEPQSGILIDRCLIGPCFDGSRIGEFNDSEIRHTVFYACRDDGFQNEGPKGKPSADNRIHDCRFINCYHDGSHQGRGIEGHAYVYRNLIEWNDAALAVPNNFSIKMIKTSEEAEVYYYHNTWIIDDVLPFKSSMHVWTDFGGPHSNASEISGFINNIIVVPYGLSDGPGGNPAWIAGNAVAASTAEAAAFLTSNGGAYAGSSASDMRLNADGSLQQDSPARLIAQAMPNHLPDSRNSPEARQDAGAFPFGERPGPDWPRPASLMFSDDIPSRWTSPGLS